ncbi:hypothetical protein [Phenylobacterium deserti]|uniref:hypothetical protein n=1 Tax=Phenylobacterium deserti TaxID=1914756 RepID=UPI001404231E|nr:hypothetical protein [Phenylobacterium deserti]
MPALSERKLQIVRTLMESAPDQVIGGLHAALADTGGDTPLASVRRLVEGEARERRLRNIILEPIAPMCVGDGRDPHHLVFPARALGAVWRGLKTVAASQIAEAELALYDYRPGEVVPPVFDRLGRLAARGVRERSNPGFTAAAEACEAAWAGGADAFVACLDLCAVVRRSIYRLQEWTGQPTEEVSITARLAYKDAVAISEDAGPRFFEMLGAQLPHRWMILRVISAVMDRPTERYLAATELAVFGERVLRDIEEALRTIAKFDLDGGVELASEAARLVELITFEATELETCIDLTHESGWGKELVKHRRSLASVVESRLRETEKYFNLALPTGAAKLKRIRRSIPRLAVAPDQRNVGRLMSLLMFLRDIRSSANYGGFASARARTLEKLGEELDSYVEEVLDFLKNGDAENEDNACAFMAIAADVSRLLRDDAAADLVRRRTASAIKQKGQAAAVAI